MKKLWNIRTKQLFVIGGILLYMIALPSALQYFAHYDKESLVKMTKALEEESENLKKQNEELVESTRKIREEIEKNQKDIEQLNVKEKEETSKTSSKDPLE